MTPRQAIFARIEAITTIVWDVSRLAYGLTDKYSYKDAPYNIVYNLKTTYPWDTRGPYAVDTAFEIHSFAVTADLAEQVAGLVNAALEKQAVTAKTMLCSREEYEIVTEPDYAQHVIQRYKLAENA